MNRYLTTTLPYVNASPHIGFASELLRADVLVRVWQLRGDTVFFNTGTDEHGQKIYEAALSSGETPQAYADRYAAEFKKLIPALGIVSDINFIRTTDPHHVAAAQEMWRRCDANGDIYKAVQKINYCVGCELEKTDSELVDGKCPLHPGKELEIREEENYFFRFSKYQDALLAFYKENSEFVIPRFRQEEITKFVESGLKDFSISRLKEKMPWGVPVPGDEAHIMFVWFDALTSYISAVGWPEKEDFGGWWPGVQLAGKDNLRQQSAIWQAMLMSAKLPNSTQVFIGGFITSGGQKMSKSLGNVISPYDLTDKYGIDATRYLLLRHVHPTEDSDVTWERLDEWYTANLVNGVGNLVARVMKLAEEHLPSPISLTGADASVEESFSRKLDAYEFNGALDLVFEHVSKGDEYMTEKEPYKKVKDEATKAEAVADIEKLVRHLAKLAAHLAPLMPTTATKILAAVGTNTKPENLFPRLG